MTCSKLPPRLVEFNDLNLFIEDDVLCLFIKMDYKQARNVQKVS